MQKLDIGHWQLGTVPWRLRPRLHNITGEWIYYMLRNDLIARFLT